MGFRKALRARPQGAAPGETRASSRRTPQPMTRVSARGLPCGTAPTFCREPTVEISNLVVARYTDGRVLKGVTQDFTPNRPIFHVHPPAHEGAAVELRFKQLKALFFVSSLDGDPSRQDVLGFVQGPAETSQGKKIAVRFKDGEFICGYTLSWTPDRDGFFLFPADPHGNNQRIFVISAATIEVKAGPAAEVLAQKVLAGRAGESDARLGQITPLPGARRPSAFLPRPTDDPSDERPTGSD